MCVLVAAVHRTRCRDFPGSTTVQLSSFQLVPASLPDHFRAPLPSQKQTLDDQPSRKLLQQTPRLQLGVEDFADYEIEQVVGLPRKVNRLTG